MRLFYTVNGGTTWRLIHQFAPAEHPGTYDWKLSLQTATKKKCKVSITLIDSKGNVLATDMSDEFFTIGL